MAVEFELSEIIEAPREKVMSHFVKVEDMPKYHPKMARSVEVMEKSENAVKYRIEAKVMLKKIASVNNMSIDVEGGKLVTDTIEGDGKGSRITMTFNETEGKTSLGMKASMELGALGSLGKGKVSSMWKEAMEEAKKELESH